MNIKSQVLRIIKELRSIDPVKHCAVYKTVGCAHVDGMLCNVRTCNIEAVILVTPRDMVDVTEKPNDQRIKSRICVALAHSTHAQTGQA